MFAVLRMFAVVVPAAIGIATLTHFVFPPGKPLSNTFVGLVEKPVASSAQQKSGSERPVRDIAW